jgi:hypothetical protein
MGPCSDQGLSKDYVLYSFLDQIIADYMARDVKTVACSVRLRELGAFF